MAASLQPDGSVLLPLRGISGHPHALDSSIDLTSWFKLGQIATTSGVANVIEFSSTNEPLRFYRLRWNP